MSSLEQHDVMVLHIDIQEKILPTIYKQDILIENLVFAAKGFKCLNITQLITEQYPKGLGPTSQILKSELSDSQMIQKTEFSAWKNEAVKNQMISLNKKQVVLTGIEAHICVLQTSLDLLRHGFEVFIPHDAVSSNDKKHKRNALQRSQQAGAQITCIESCFFEIMQSSEHPKFKDISALLKLKK